MLQSQLTISLPDGACLTDASVAHPETTVSVLAGVPVDDDGSILLHLAGPDGDTVDAFLAHLTGCPDVVQTNVLERTESEATVEFEPFVQSVLFASEEAGMPIEYPVEIRNGRATVETTGPEERLSRLVALLRSLDLDFEVDYTREVPDVTPLSERQRELVVTAVERGYYDTPRRCSLTELADEVGISKSACSETLHRAEETIVKRYTGSHRRFEPT